PGETLQGLLERLHRVLPVVLAGQDVTVFVHGGARLGPDLLTRLGRGVGLGRTGGRLGGLYRLFRLAIPLFAGLTGRRWELGHGDFLSTRRRTGRVRRRGPPAAQEPPKTATTPWVNNASRPNTIATMITTK